MNINIITHFVDFLYKIKAKNPAVTVAKLNFYHYFSAIKHDAVVEPNTNVSIKPIFVSSFSSNIYLVIEEARTADAVVFKIILVYLKLI